MRRHAKQSTNLAPWRPSNVTLFDGRVVASDSEEWRNECEARAVLAMKTVDDRRNYLFGEMDENGLRSGGVKRRRKTGLHKLEQMIQILWQNRHDQRIG